MSSFTSDEEWNLNTSKTRRKNIGMETKGEVRKLHIIYFISRMGHIEHPHLIRVHHLARNGVYLKDVKRWLGELRGKDMPEAFAWSYKRRYKTGYVWQDLLDDDLITPISDNEYVLKGSQFNPFPVDTTTSPVGENDDPVSGGKKHEKMKQKSSCPRKESHLPDPKAKNPTNVTFNNDHESPPFTFERPTILKDQCDALKFEEKLPAGEEGNEKERESNSESSFPYMSNLSDKNSKCNKDKIHLLESSLSSSSSSQAPFTKRYSNQITKKYSNEAARMFRKLLSCRAVDTDAAALVKTKMTRKTILNKPNDRQRPVTQIYRQGSVRVFDTTQNKQQQQGKQ